MLDLVEEIKFAELKEMCKELKVVPPPDIMINFKVTEKDRVVFDDVQRGHSWTRNFYNYIYSLSSNCPGGNSNNFGAGYMSSKNTAGTIGFSSSVCCGASSGFVDGRVFRAAAGSLTGIVLGTGDTAFNINQFSLVTAIANGTSSGQFSYQASTVAVPVYTAGTKTWATTLQRVVNNNSGGAITVKEVGLFYIGGQTVVGIFSNSSTEVWMLERSVLSPTVTVADGAQLTVSYSISTSFSAID